MIIKNDSWFSKARVETFSDGVFAIIVTLLVFELKVPLLKNADSDRELAAALVHLFPKLLSWIVSFLMICVIWVNHHRIFERVECITHSIFWLNAYLLLWCAFIPFPTALIGDYPNSPVALSIFGLVLSLMGSAFVLMRFVIMKQNLLQKKYDRQKFKQSTRKTILFGMLFYLSGAMIAWVSPIVSLLIYVVVPFYFIFFNTTDSIIQLKQEQ